MVFSDTVYLLFLAFVLLLSPILRGRSQIVFWIISSFIFYAAWNPVFLLIMVGSTFLDYYLATMIHAAENPRRRRLLLLSIIINLGLLGYFKYIHFAWSNVQGVGHFLGFEIPAWPFQVVLPLGISFYTFQTMSYTIDVYYRTLAPCKSLLHYAFYISFFPQLVAGPIMRGSEFLPQVEKARKVDGEDVREAMGLFFRGYVKKVCVADTLGIMLIDPVYTHPEIYSSITLWLAAVGYSVQVYGDFSGYTDMGRASARLLGFHIPINFNNPFLAVNPQDFWRRWHITLSQWIRDYVFLSWLNGFRAKGAKLFGTIMLTMTLAGLWHGANWTLICWGIYHGFWLVAHYFYRTALTRGGIWQKWNRRQVYIWTCRISTFVLFSVGQVFGRAQDFETVGIILKGMAGCAAGTTDMIAGRCILLISATLAVHTWPLFPESVRSLRWCPAFLRDMGYTVILTYMILTLSSGVRPFIYFQF